MSIDIFLESPFLIVLMFSLIFLIVFITTVILNSIFGPFLKKEKLTKDFPFVSILIPARNEERNIENVIESIKKQNYPNYELIILNDNSIDNTYNIAKKAIQPIQKAKIINGIELPTDWLGKNWACKQLADESKGEILIFTDADNFFDENAISKTVNIINRYKLDMFSVFPQQITSSFWEKLIIPIIDLIIYSGLILKTTLLVPLSAFAAANGQWIAVRRKSYFEIGGHQSVKNHIVEDVALSRVFKQSNKRILTGAGTEVVFGKMYSNFSEIWHGLSKNVFGLTNFKTIPFFIILIVFIFTSVIPYISIFVKEYFYFSLILISLNIFWRGLLAINFKHNLLLSIILHPISIIIFVIIGLNSFYQSKYGVLNWKGRKITID